MHTDTYTKFEEQVETLREQNEALQNDLVRAYELLTTKTSKMLTEILDAKNKANSAHFRALDVEQYNDKLKAALKDLLEATASPNTEGWDVRVRAYELLGIKP